MKGKKQWKCPECNEERETIRNVTVAVCPKCKATMDETDDGR